MAVTLMTATTPLSADELNDRLEEIETGIGGLGGIPAGAVVAYAGDSAPTGWLLCDGSAVSRTTYAALFAAIGTTYGVGNGSTTFNLPDLRGRTPIGAGQGSGLTNRTRGQQVGAETHVLIEAELPSHTHTVIREGSPLTSGGAVSVASGIGNTGATGGGQAHNNMQPSLVLNFIIKG